MKIIITGPAASGKDVLRRRLQKRGFLYAKPYTTRPMRDGESDEDYSFIGEDEFDAMHSASLFAVCGCYNGWKYGIAMSDYAASTVAVLTPEYIGFLSANGLMKNCFTILLMPDEETRRERLSLRKDADSVERRISADREQFSSFTEYDMIITNPNF